MILVLGSVLVGVLSVWRVNEAALTLRLRCESVTFVLDREWAWDGRLRLAESAAINNVSKIETALFADPVQGQAGDAWLTLDGGSISLDRLDVARDVRLQLEVDDDGGIDLSMDGGRASGQLQALGAPRVAAGTPLAVAAPLYPVPLEPPEVVTFRTAGNGARPTTLHLRPHSPTLLRGFVVRELSFRRRVSPRPGIPEWQSTIHEGTVLVRNAPGEQKLEEGQALRLEGVRGRLISVRVDDDIEVIFEGRAQSVRTGFDEDGMSEVKPTRLEYWHQKYKHYEPAALLGSLWSVAIALRARRKVAAGLLLPLALAGAAALAPRTAAAESLPRTRQLQTNVVQVLVGADRSSVGFGFIVGERDQTLYVVTARHVVRSRDGDEQAKIGVRFCYDLGDRRDAYLRTEEETGNEYKALDLAVLLVDKPASLEPVTMRTESVRPGHPAWFLGADGGCRASGRGVVEGEPGVNHRFPVTGLGSAPGASGSPVVGERGLLGMLVASTNQASEAVSMEGILRALHRSPSNDPTNLIQDVPDRCTRCRVTKAAAGLALLSVGWAAWERHQMDTQRSRYTAARSVAEADVAEQALRSADHRRDLALDLGAGLAAAAVLNHLLPHGHREAGDSRWRVELGTGPSGRGAAVQLRASFR